MGFVLLFALCCMVCSAGRCSELCLLTLYELSFLAGSFVDLVTAEQRQDNKKGRLKPSNVHDIGLIHCFLPGCFPTMCGHMLAQAKRLALVR